MSAFSDVQARPNVGCRGLSSQTRPIILFVVNEITYFFSHRLPVARIAMDLGFDVHLAAYGAKRFVDALRHEGVTGHELPLRRGASHPFSEFSALVSVLRLMRRLSPTVVHAVTVKPVLLAGLAARLLNVEGVVLAVNGLGFAFTSHAPKARVLRTLALPVFRLVLRNPNATTIVQNPDDRDTLLLLKAVRPEQVTLIRGSGVDCDRFHPTPEPPGVPVVVFASRMIWDKGVGEVVQAARIARSQGVVVRVVLVGAADPDNPRSVSTNQLDAWHSSGIIEWWGKRDDMKQVFAASHIVCLPSYYGEGLPKVLLEAAATGRPIITTNLPGCREIGRSGENALVVPPRDAAAVADAIKTLVRDPALRSRLGARGRELVMSEFSEAHVVRATAAIYERLLHGA